ncbi:MAG: hypothetical protein U0807_00420 [Candidatus Binatia bacterium]
MRAALLAATFVLAPRLLAAGPPTFSVDYVVTIRDDDPAHAHVRWLLAGIDEIESLRLVFRDERSTDVHGTGHLAWRGRAVTWTPGGPYAHLEYTVAIARARPPARYDSYAGRNWIATRALHLFPEINVSFRPGASDPRARARLVFHLPHGWRAAAAGERQGPRTFAVDEPHKRFDRPRGWILLGAVDLHVRDVDGMRVTVAVAPGSQLDPRKLLALLDRTVPLLTAILGPPPPRLLVASAPDPMWHGGLSGEESFFVNGRIPLRSPDRTSTYLHELFHVWAPFHPEVDGRWISEGLAEYYSLELPHRAGRLTDEQFAKGLELFARYGRWDVDLSRTREPAALNNSAPLVLHLLDRAIAKASSGQANLDDAVRTLVRRGGTLTTAGLVDAASHAAGRDLGPLVDRHVRLGERPSGPFPRE